MVNNNISLNTAIMSGDPRTLYKCLNLKCTGSSYKDGEECLKCRSIVWRTCSGICGKSINKEMCSSCRSLPFCGGGCGKKVVSERSMCSKCKKDLPLALLRH